MPTILTSIATIFLKYLTFSSITASEFEDVSMTIVVNFSPLLNWKTILRYFYLCIMKIVSDANWLIYVMVSCYVVASLFLLSVRTWSFFVIFNCRVYRTLILFGPNWSLESLIMTLVSSVGTISNTICTGVVQYIMYV